MASGQTDIADEELDNLDFGDDTVVSLTAKILEINNRDDLIMLTR